MYFKKLNKIKPYIGESRVNEYYFEKMTFETIIARVKLILNDKLIGCHVSTNIKLK